jgi:hypothetical protein
MFQLNNVLLSTAVVPCSDLLIHINDSHAAKQQWTKITYEYPIKVSQETK